MYLSTTRPSSSLYAVCFRSSVHDLNLLGDGAGDGPTIPQLEHQATQSTDGTDSSRASGNADAPRRRRQRPTDAATPADGGRFIIGTIYSTE